MEQILYDHGPSFRLPFRPRTSDIAGRTKNIVLVPVIANTVQISVISPYHLSVPLGGISFGDNHLCINDRFFASLTFDIDLLFSNLEKNLF
jgi:hypothetical protein